MIVLISCVSAQSNSRNRIRYSNQKFGPALVAGGVIFTVAGFTTSPDWQYSGASQSNIQGNNYYAVQNKPFFTNSPRTMIICTGATLTIVGLISLIAGR